MSNKIFLSYTDLKDFEGKVSEFRHHLKVELQIATGDAQLTVFQDTRNIHGGDQWKEKLASELDSAKVLLILLSPLWLNRPWCRAEYLRFRKTDANGTARRPIVPVVWVKTSDDDVKESESRAILTDLKEFQMVDWCGLRHKNWKSSKLNEAVSKLAEDIKLKLQHQ